MDVTSRLVLAATRFVSRHRRSLPVKLLGQTAYLFWRAYENRSFDMQSNGEEWCVKKIATLKPRCIFDVGANVGDWVELCKAEAPDATIHAFEIAPDTFKKLKQRVGESSKLHLNPFGLSDREAEIELYFPEASDYRATAYKENLTAAFEAPGESTPAVRTVKAQVLPGDDYARKNGIQEIDFLKIDVEGMEKSVLSGFKDMFSRRQIRAVQFEYNTTNIVSGFLLRDAYELLGEFGYRVGKLYPNYVDFRDYHYRHEDFGGPNMIAVRSDDRELLKVLAGG
ncbi:MAG TPA: FkbM family methyltransferase [Candidatus Paceibacterota bacterium]|nr:FkbM family methyltransferase [Candidatus Paceibacterota bacterium]